VAFPFELPLYATAALAGGPILFARGFRTLRTQQLIRNTPTAKIRSMAMGLVEVTGTVVPRSRIVAPFSGRACAYWEVDVSSRGKSNYTVIHRNRSGHPFYLRDATGIALVYPGGAELKINFGTSEDCLGVSLPDCYASYLAENGGIGLTLARGGTLRFRERVLEEGQIVYVLGTATPRATVQTITELAATGTDDAAPNRVQTLDHDVSGVIRQGTNERTFLISQQPESQVAFGLGLHAGAMLLGGPLLTLCGLGYWLLRLTSKGT